MKQLAILRTVVFKSLREGQTGMPENDSLPPNLVGEQLFK